MAWKAIDRRTPVVDAKAPPVLSEAVREKIRSFFPRYETKRAALLPALHVVQNALGYVGLHAMKEIAELLEIPPSAVLDTLSFYTHFWDHPKGRKVIVACRSLSCQLMGSDALLQAIKDELDIEEHGRFAHGHAAEAQAGHSWSRAVAGKTVWRNRLRPRISSMRWRSLMAWNYAAASLKNRVRIHAASSMAPCRCSGKRLPGGCRVRSAPRVCRSKLPAPRLFRPQAPSQSLRGQISSRIASTGVPDDAGLLFSCRHSSIRLATRPVQPVWWLAPRPAPLSP